MNIILSKRKIIITTKEWVGEEIFHEISHGISLEEVAEYFFGVPEGETESERTAEAESIKRSKTSIL